MPVRPSLLPTNPLAFRPVSWMFALFACAGVSPLACSAGDNANNTASDGGPGPTGQDGGGSDATPATKDGAVSIVDGSTTADAPTHADANGGGPDATAPNNDAGGAYPAGWLYTSGSKIYVSDGHSGGTQWMGRGVNVDDIYLCGYDNTLAMTAPDQTLETMISGLMSGWKPSFVRISLGMDSYATVSTWVGSSTPYKTPMTNVINAMGANPKVHVLITLRSDASMIGQDTVDGDPEATGLPSDSTTTPSSTTYPTGTDATYVALVDTFANSGFAMFGLTNEPGGNKLSNAQIAAAMSHAVGVIRAEEDKLGVPHHIVSVQGNGWTSDISFYASTPIAYENVVYEVHGYPPTAASYTYSNIPVIIGEYGTLADSTSFFADLEAKQIPNLAWDFDSYSDCAPDLLTVNQSATTLTPSAWGSTVQSYLLAHVP